MTSLTGARARVGGSAGMNGGGVTSGALAAAIAGLAPGDATYIVQTANGTLTNEQALDAIASLPGIAKINADGSISKAVGADLPSHTHTGVVSAIAYLIDGGGAEIATGIHGPGLMIPFACTITKATALADQSGSIVVDIWKDSYANYPPDNSDSITASAPVTISTATKSEDATLSSWTTSVSAGDILRFNVDSVTDIEALTITLTITRTV